MSDSFCHAAHPWFFTLLQRPPPQGYQPAFLRLHSPRKGTEPEWMSAGQSVPGERQSRAESPCDPRPQGSHPIR